MTEYEAAVVKHLRSIADVLAILFFAVAFGIGMALVYWWRQ